MAVVIGAGSFFHLPAITIVIARPIPLLNRGIATTNIAALPGAISQAVSEAVSEVVLSDFRDCFYSRAISKLFPACSAS